MAPLLQVPWALQRPAPGHSWQVSEAESSEACAPKYPALEMLALPASQSPQLMRPWPSLPAYPGLQLQLPAATVPPVEQSPWPWQTPAAPEGQLTEHCASAYPEKHMQWPSSALKLPWEGQTDSKWAMLREVVGEGSLVHMGICGGQVRGLAW